MVKKKIIIPRKNIYKQSKVGGADAVTWIGATSALVALIGGITLLTRSDGTPQNSLISFNKFKSEHTDSTNPLMDFIIKQKHSSLGQIMLKGNILNELTYDPYRVIDNNNSISYYFNINKHHSFGRELIREKKVMEQGESEDDDERGKSEETPRSVYNSDIYKPDLIIPEGDIVSLITDYTSISKSKIPSLQQLIQELYGPRWKHLLLGGAGVGGDGGGGGVEKVKWKTCSRKWRSKCKPIEKALDEELQSTGYMLNLLRTSCMTSDKKDNCIIQFSWKPHYNDGRNFSGIWKEDKQKINISYFGTETWHNDKKNLNSVSEDTKTNLVILSGPSSAGKTYIAKEALENGILSNEHFPNNFLKIDGGDMRERSIIFNTLANYIGCDEKTKASNDCLSDHMNGKSAQSSFNLPGYMDLYKFAKFGKIKKTLQQFLREQIHNSKYKLKISIMLPDTLVSSFFPNCVLKTQKDASKCLYDAIVKKWWFYKDSGDEKNDLYPTLFLIYRHKNNCPYGHPSVALTLLRDYDCLGTEEAGLERSKTEAKPYSSKNHDTAITASIFLMKHEKIKKGISIITHNTGQQKHTSKHWVITNGDVTALDSLNDDNNEYTIYERNNVDHSDKITQLLTVEGKLGKRKWIFADSQITIEDTPK